jgi:hypothetical protein
MVITVLLIFQQICDTVEVVCVTEAGPKTSSEITVIQFLNRDYYTSIFNHIYAGENCKLYH